MVQGMAEIELYLRNEALQNIDLFGDTEQVQDLLGNNRVSEAVFALERIRKVETTDREILITYAMPAGDNLVYRIRSDISMDTAAGPSRLFNDSGNILNVQEAATFQLIDSGNGMAGKQRSSKKKKRKKAKERIQQKKFEQTQQLLPTDKAAASHVVEMTDKAGKHPKKSKVRRAAGQIITGGALIAAILTGFVKDSPTIEREVDLVLYVHKRGTLSHNIDEAIVLKHGGYKDRMPGEHRIATYSLLYRDIARLIVASDIVEDLRRTIKSKNNDFSEFALAIELPPSEVSSHLESKFYQKKLAYLIEHMKHYGIDSFEDLEKAVRVDLSNHPETAKKTPEWSRPVSR
jgi:hypothetical protein